MKLLHTHQQSAFIDLSDRRMRITFPDARDGWRIAVDAFVRVIREHSTLETLLGLRHERFERHDANETVKP